MLYGRDTEIAAIGALLERARSGRSGALILSGEAGIGKTALLERARSESDGMTVLSATGVETGAELAYSGLRALLADHHDRIDALPPGQAKALGSAIGRNRDGTDHFQTGMAVLTLLSDLADERPVVCLVDDAQWIDQVTVKSLLFAARRLDAEGIALFIGVRDGETPLPATEIEELKLGRLDVGSCEKLVDRHPRRLGSRERRQVIAEADGNPLALMALADSGGTAGTDRGEAAKPAGRDTGTDRVLHMYRARVRALPAETRLGMLTAAVDSANDFAVIAATMSALDVTVAGLAPAELAGLLVSEGRSVSFPHPLVRSAVVAESTPDQRQAVHRALADALDPRTHADRRAWHLAEAATGTDHEVAEALAASALHARSRGGYAAEAAAFERAAELTEDVTRHDRYLIAAASAAQYAGDVDRAERLADRVTMSSSDPVELAELAEAKANIAMARGDSTAAYRDRLDAAGHVMDSDPALAASMLFMASLAAWNARDHDRMRDITAKLAGLPVTADSDAAVVVRAGEGLARLAAGEPGLGIPPLRELVYAARDPKTSYDQHVRITAQKWEIMVGDIAAAYQHETESLQRFRGNGAIGHALSSMTNLARLELLRGMPRQARATLDVALKLARDLAIPEMGDQAIGLLGYAEAVDGDAERCRELADQCSSGGTLMGEAGLALLELGLGRHADALRHRETVYARYPHAIFTLFTLPDHVEAAVFAGEVDRAAEHDRRFREWARATEQPWALAVTARCAALLAADGDAADHYDTALRWHRDDGRPFEQARTRFLYGQWLRGRGDSVTARPLLRAAMETFTHMGAMAWSRRARRELRAAGERHVAPSRAEDVLDRLTPQEKQVVRLAAKGMNNREIAAELFLSHRTVGFYLYKSFPKLGISSRAELGGIVAA